MDSDSIFVSQGLSLADLIEKDKDMVLTGDVWDIFNTGHFLLRAGDFGRKWLDAWWAQRGLAFEKLETTHQDSAGRLNEQPVANALLGIGLDLPITQITAALPQGFSRVNGFIGNSSRQHKDFHTMYAPNRARNLSRTQSLLHPSLSSKVLVVPQRRLNGYMSRQKGELFPTSMLSPIIHFAGSKSRLLKLAASEE